MATPPLPPRPIESYNGYQPRPRPLPPPLPPLPPDFHPEPLSPHLAEPLVAPRPQKVLSEVPADMARRLDDQLAQPDIGGYYQGLAVPGFRQSMPPQRGPSPYLPQPGFAPPNMGPSPRPSYTPPRTGLSPQMGWNQPQARPPRDSSLPPPQQRWSNGSPYPPLGPGYQSASPLPIQQPPSSANPNYPRSSSLGNDMQNLNLNGQPQPQPYRATQNRVASQPMAPAVQLQDRRPSPPRADTKDGVPALTAAFPTIQSLTAARNVTDPKSQVSWCRDVFWLLDRSLQVGGTAPPPGPAKISDAQLQSLAEQAVNTILRVAPQQPAPNPPMYIAEAIYIRGKLANTGQFPDLLPQSPRDAFRLFEASARGGYSPGWFQLGRDYENVKDNQRARDCFERGVKAGVETCYYRMGMANLLGQLDMPVDMPQALQLLRSGALNASLEAPQPAYVYGLLLLGEFPAATIPPHLFDHHLPPGTIPQVEAKKHIERSAFLGFSPAQYKMGHAFEYAIPPFPFDPLLSVQYYSLASQQGEDEADMALSKWFLCGSEGAFEKDENLAYVFADKAARKGLATAQFALGYYAEVGVGRPKDLELAKKWYNKAAAQGNTDAKDRIQALSQASPQTLSRQEHENITDSQLVRTRTQAKNKAAAAGRSALPKPEGQNANEVVGMIRNHSRLQHPAHRHSTAQSASGNQPLPPRGGGPPSPPAPDPGNERTPRIGSGSPPRRPTDDRRRPSNSRPGNTPPIAAVPEEGEPPVPRPPQKGPATFQEMGFQSTKLDNEKCVIM